MPAYLMDKLYNSSYRLPNAEPWIPNAIIRNEKGRRNEDRLESARNV